MELSSAMTLLESELERQGLAGQGWTAGWDRARLRFGACWPRRKQITLSHVLTELNDVDQVRDTILHEVAHALVFERFGHLRGHGAEWKRVALELGATPRACSKNGKLPPGRFALVHRGTGEVFRTYQRRPKRFNLHGRYIRGRKKDTLNQLAIIEL